MKKMHNREYCFDTVNEEIFDELVVLFNELDEGQGNVILDTNGAREYYIEYYNNIHFDEFMFHHVYFSVHKLAERFSIILNKHTSAKYGCFWCCDCIDFKKKPTNSFRINITFKERNPQNG